jgi:hypothetical protein
MYSGLANGKELLRARKTTVPHFVPHPNQDDSNRW